MNFTLKNSILVASLLLLVNAHSEQQNLNSVGGGENSLLTSNNNVSNTILSRNYVNNIKDVNNNINTVNENINWEQFFHNLSDSIFNKKNGYITIKPNASYAKFQDDSCFNYINNALNVFQSNYGGPIRRNAVMQCFDTISKMEIEDLMRLSLIFNCMLNNNSNTQVDESLKKSDRFEMYRIFCNVNEDVKSRINNSKYILEFSDELLNMMIAQYFELVIKGKIREGKIILVTPVMKLLCNKVKTSDDLLSKLSILESNSDVLKYNTKTLRDNIENNSTMDRKEMQDNMNVISNIFTKETNGFWNTMVEFVNDNKEPIDTTIQEGTDEYYEEYRNKNKLIKTLDQFVILTNIIFANKQ